MYRSGGRSRRIDCRVSSPLAGKGIPGVGWIPAAAGAVAALASGRSWEDLEPFVADISDGVFISRNLEVLRKRGVEMLFHPGTLVEGSGGSVIVPLPIFPVPAPG